MKRTTYGPAEAAQAAGTERATLHSWLARRYVEVASKGAGRSREFSFEDVIRIAVIAELDRHGIQVGTASNGIALLRGEFRLAVREIVESGAQKVILLTRYGDEQSASILNYDGIQMAMTPLPGTEAYHPMTYIAVDLTRLLHAVRSKLGAG